MKYQQLTKDVDVLVYNAWRLDFGLAIHSFDPFLHATRDLIDLSLTSQRNARVIFVSYMFAVENVALAGSVVPETLVQDPLAAM